MAASSRSTSKAALSDSAPTAVTMASADLSGRRHTPEHLDFHELTLDLGAELGVLLVRAQRALASVEGVGRVHVYKWGDGGAHLHVIVVARPRGMMQLRGMFLTVWAATLPALPADEWDAIRGQVTAHLAGG